MEKPVLQSRKISSNSHEVQWAKHTQNIREEERARIAREIHDELGQLLTAIKVETFLLNNSVKTDDPALKEQLSRMVSLVNEASRAVERIATELRPGILNRLGLVAAIDWQSKEFEKRTNIKSATIVTGNVNVELDHSLNIFRVFQEALTNVARHSGASQVDTRLEVKGSSISLVVKDNGRGFDPSKVERALGLTGMKERAIMLGGNLVITSAAGEGTIIHLTVPLSQKNR